MSKAVVDIGLVGLEHVGSWNPDTIYNRNQIVQFKDQAWTPAHDGVQGVEPVEGEDWFLFLGDATETIRESYENVLRAEAAAEDSRGEADRAQEAAKLAQTIAQGAQGYYLTADLLKETHKTGEDGWWAIVGETDTIWVWDSDSQSWTDSGNKTDLSNYYTKDEADDNLDELQRTITQATDEKLNKKFDADGVLPIANGGTGMGGVKQYLYRGWFINSVGGTTVGYGPATITVFPDNFVRIDFTAKIEVAGSVVGQFNVGINRDAFTRTVGRVIHPIEGGRILWFRNNVIYSELFGYGMYACPPVPNSQYWGIWRCYQIAEDNSSLLYGGWGDAVYGKGDIITGTVFGTL